MTNVINANGTTIDFDASIGLMDDAIRETLHEALAPCTTQEFFSAYEMAHLDKFAEEWELAKANPIW